MAKNVGKLALPSGDALGSKIVFDRGYPANATYTNDLRAIKSDISYLLGRDYIMFAGQGSERANSGYETSFKLYKNATIYVFVGSNATANETVAKSNGWTFATSSGGNWMDYQLDNAKSFSQMMTKKFSNVDTTNGTSVTITKEMLYTKSTDCGVVMVVIDFDNNTVPGTTVTPPPSTAPTPSAEPTPSTAPTKQSPYATAASNASTVKFTKDGAEQTVNDNSTGVKSTAMRGLAVSTDTAYGTKYFANRNQPQDASTGYTNEILSIASNYSFLLGQDYVMSTSGGSNERAHNGWETSFVLNSDATVYFFTDQGNDAAAKSEGWALLKAADNDHAFMTVQTNEKLYFKYVYVKRFTDVPAGGTEVVLKRSLLNNTYSNGFVAIDDTGHDVPGIGGVKNVKIAKDNGDNTESKLGTSWSSGSLLGTNLTPYKAGTAGSYIMIDRTSNASYADYNNIFDIAADYSFIEGCDYIGVAAQNDGTNGYHRASGGYEASFDLYEGATIYVFTSVANSAAATENGWTYQSSTDAPYMKLRYKPSDDGIDNFKYVMTKHFDGALSGQTVTIPKEMLYPAGGGEGSSGLCLTVIKYDK